MSPLRHPFTLATPAVPRLAVRRENTALLIQDMQQFFTNPDKGYGAVARARGIAREFKSYYDQLSEVVPSIAKVAAEVRSLDMPVIYTKWAYSDESPPSLAQKSIGMVLHQSDEDAAVHPELKPEPEDTVLCKTGFSAFSTPALDDELQARGVENLLITGVMSEFGIRATALAAVDTDYRPLLIKDCCAGITSESHRAMMSGMTFATMKARSTRELLLDLGGLENEDVVLV